LAQTCLGDLAEGNPGLRRVLEDADAAHDPVTRALCLITFSFGLTYQGDLDAARVTAEEAIAAGEALGGFNLDTAYAVLGLAAFAAGDPTAARIANDKALHHRVPEREPLTLSLAPLAEVATTSGDPAEARRWADTVVSRTSHWHLMRALSTRARVTLAQGEPQQAERDVYDALAMVTDMQAHLTTPDLLETLAVLTARTGGHREAARLFGAAHAMRQRIGVVRFKIDEGDYVHDVEDVRTALSDSDFEAAWDQGSALSTEEALAYAQRGRGERKRPTSGWESLTPTEREVVQLVSKGLANKDVATRMLISPRTVQTHLTHVYTKLGLTSRMQLMAEAARHA
jgi:DNA-binding CsgD family transcriptional regulator